MERPRDASAGSSTVRSVLRTTDSPSKDDLFSRPLASQASEAGAYARKVALSEPTPGGPTLYSRARSCLCMTGRRADKGASASMAPVTIWEPKPKGRVRSLSGSQLPTLPKCACFIGRNRRTARGWGKKPRGDGGLHRGRGFFRSILRDQDGKGSLPSRLI
jgi:hypothetical protein